MRFATTVLAYHGCNRAVGERILAGDADLRLSENDYDWLGGGIYFWENNPARALEWARLVQRHGKVSRTHILKPFVIGAVVDVGNCLDLLEAESIRIVEESHRRLKAAFDSAGMTMPENRIVGGEMALRHLDCAVINYAHQFAEGAGKPPFDSVRAAFVEGDALNPGAGFHRHTHVQLCIRDARQIVGYFRPRS